MARAQDGDAGAYRRLLESITPWLRKLCFGTWRSPQDVEDVVQDILLTIHAVRRTYDPARPFGPWLKAIAMRRIIDRRRSETRWHARHGELTADHEDVATHSEPAREPSADLEAAIARLPRAQQLAIRLLKVRDMSLKEAANTTGISVAALKTATHRGLSSLRRLLNERSDD